MKIKPSTIIANRYEIIEQIGSGGMSIVYKAKDRKLGRIVTFKVMRAEYIKDGEFIKRFDVEARAAASLSHNNIVNVYDVGQDGFVHYIVMEYIDGVTLKDLIMRRAPFDNDEILGVAIQIASALNHAHKHNIIHRDIKPQNILVTSNGTVKVTDFGIAKASTSKTITVANNTMGSVHYFSPEQAKGSFVTAKSDIYSLGLVMYEMATGKLPFDGDTPVSIAIKQINDLLPDIKQYNANVTESIEKIIIRATDKFASKRYTNADELEVDLKRALTNQVGDFNMQDDSPTVRLTEEDITSIKNETKLNADDGEDYYDPDYEYNKQAKKAERKVVMSAVITSVVIILLLSFVGYNTFFNHKPVEVPVLIGKTLDEAKSVAKELGVKIKDAGTEYNNEVEKDKISSQNYNEGDNLYRGDVIDVKLSLGVEQVTMPYVVNKDLKEAYNIFGDIPFEFREIYVNDDNVPINIIKSQEPSSGTLVDSNAEVKLYISKGAEIKNVTVPSVIGMTESEAKVKLQSLGLVVGVVSKANSSKYDEGLVITQTIASGSEVQTGSVISFVVSRGPEATPRPTAQPTTKPTPTFETKTLTVDSVNVPENATKVKIRILRVTSDGPETFYEDEVEKTNLPLKFNITPDKAGEYQMYLIGDDGTASLQWSTNISF